MMEIRHGIQSTLHKYKCWVLCTVEGGGDGKYIYWNPKKAQYILTLNLSRLG